MNTQTLTDQFRHEYAKDAVTTMLSAIRDISSHASWVTKIALGVSMPHQIGYLMSEAIPHMHGDTVSGWLDSIGMVLLAVATPIVCDFVILMCIKTVGSAASRWSKARALGIITAYAGVSGIVNFLAPGPLILKLLAAFVVASIPVAEVLRMVKPDFNALENLETQIATTAPVGPAKREISKAEIKARKKAGYDDMTPADKRRFTQRRKARAPRMPKNIAEFMKMQTADAPISGAPASTR